MKQPSASVELQPWCESGRIVELAGAPGDGPDVVIVAGLHGNEPDGVTAGKAVISAIRASGALPGHTDASWRGSGECSVGNVAIYVEL